MKGTSFTISTDKVDSAVKKLIESEIKINDAILKKMTKAVDVVYKTATAKRPMITVAQAKAEGRRKFINSSGKIQQHRVSDPAAKAGVPVAMIDGGTLQASIKKEVFRKVIERKTVGRVYTENEYANALEFGTSRIAPRPFMRPAGELNKDMIKKIFNIKD